MKVDGHLIREASLLTTGSEIHRTNELIRCYVGATMRPDRVETAAEIMARLGMFQQCEMALLQHVEKLRSRRVRCQPWMQHATARR